MEKVKNEKRTISVKVLTSIIALVLMLIVFVLPANNNNLGSIQAEAAGGVSIDPLAPSPDVDAPEAELLSAVKFKGMVSLHLGGAMLDDQGAVWMWGYNAYGMQAIGIPYNEGGIARYNGGMKRIGYFLDRNIEIAQITGTYHTMYALDTEGKMYAWGYGFNGNMGNGTRTEHNNLPVLVNLPAGEKVVEMYSGVEAAHAIFVRCESGNIYGWGYAGVGWSNPFITGPYVTTPTLLTELTALNNADGGNNIVSMSLGTYHGMACTKDGKVYTWGADGSGQLGNGTGVTATTHVTEVSYFTLHGIKAVQVAGSTLQSLVLTEDGSVYQFGLLYHTSYAGVAFQTPMLVDIDYTSAEYVPVFNRIANGRYAYFAIDQHGRIWSWGNNKYYQWGVDGPLYGSQGTTVQYVWTNPNRGKLDTCLQKATQIPKTLGDGDVEQFNHDNLGPVFSGYCPTISTEPSTPASKNTWWGYLINHYFNMGCWTMINEASNPRHPTIYDKKYYVTDREPSSWTGAPSTDGTGNVAARAALHKNVYLMDKDGNRLVYVVRRDGGTTANPTYEGNFYVIDDTWTNASGQKYHEITSNAWYLDWRTTVVNATNDTDGDGRADLPAGIKRDSNGKEMTSVPQVKDEERGWIENATGETPIDFTGTQHSEIPYIVDFKTYQSNILAMDNAGNVYRSTLDGSGTIAWGWDYTAAYDWGQIPHNYTTNTVGMGGTGVQYPHAVDGLFDMYCYELMFLRGSPRISPTYVQVQSPIKKIYKSETEQEQDTNVKVVLGTATVSEQLNIEIYPELTKALYVKIPYDEDDPRMNQLSVTETEFMAAYNGAQATDRGDLIDLNTNTLDPQNTNPWVRDSDGELKNTSATATKTLEDNGHITVDDNCVLWVLTITSGYSANVAAVEVQKYDNYYTDTTLKHDGENVDDPYEKIYTETDKYIEKTSALTTGEDPDIYGVPLDKNGVVIGSGTTMTIDPDTNEEVSTQNPPPTFGYDEVTIRAFESGDPEYDLYINGWYLIDPDDTPVIYTLDDEKYLIDTSTTPAAYFVHTFYYERDPTGWVTITYRGRYLGSTQNISPFDMLSIQSTSEQVWFITEYQETVRKTTAATTITLERKPVAIDNAQVVHYTVDGTQKSLNSSGNLEFDTISDTNASTMEVIIYYSQAELYARQMIYDAVNDVLIPSEGYFRLNLTDGTTTADTFNMMVNSGDDEDTVAFKKVLLTTDVTNQKFLIDPVIPQLYKYYGYSVSTTEAAHSTATINTTDEPLVDYTTNSKYYVTIYLTPTVQSSKDVPFYNWDYKLNEFGEIKAATP